MALPSPLLDKRHRTNITFIIPSVPLRKSWIPTQDRNLGTGTEKEVTEDRGMILTGFLSLFSYTTQDYLSRVGITPRGKPCNYLQSRKYLLRFTYRPVFWRQFPDKLRFGSS